MKYKGFVIDFYEYIPIIYAYNNNIDMSFSLGLTDIQKAVYDNMHGNDYWKNVLTNSVKKLIDDYYETRR